MSVRLPVPCQPTILVIPSFLPVCLFTTYFLALSFCMFPSCLSVCVPRTFLLHCLLLCYLPVCLPVFLMPSILPHSLCFLPVSVFLLSTSSICLAYLSLPTHAHTNHTSSRPAILYTSTVDFSNFTYTQWPRTATRVFSVALEFSIMILVTRNGVQ